MLLVLLEVYQIHQKNNNFKVIMTICNRSSDLLPQNPSPHTFSCQSFLCGRRPVSCHSDLQVTSSWNIHIRHVLYFKYPLNYPGCIVQITPIRVIVVACRLSLCLLLPAVWNTFWWKMWSKLFICGGWSGSVIAEIVVVNTAGSPCSPWLRFLKRLLFGVSSYKQGFVFVLFCVFFFYLSALFGHLLHLL